MISGKVSALALQASESEPNPCVSTTMKRAGANDETPSFCTCSESLQYVLESVPIVDRAFVHVDYASYNLPTHMEQQAE
jgi:hypothetical protein